MVTKPTKQQIEQGKARAGGNNPVKVTKAGVKRLGQAALIAASLTPIGRTAKIAGIIAKPISKVVQARSVKNTKVVVEKIAKMQEKAKAERIASNSVKVKPRTTAPKTDLSNRGARLTPKEQARRASDLDFGKMEQRIERSTEMRSTGLVSSRKGLVAARGPGKNNQRKANAIKKEATKENFYEQIRKPIKINSQSNLKKK